MKKEIVIGATRLGPYSAAVENNGTLYVSGQLGINADGNLVGPDAASQACRALERAKFIVEAAGYTMDSVLKCLVFLTDMSDFTAVNEVYETFFTTPYPARSCVQVAALPRGGKVEIEMIAGK